MTIDDCRYFKLAANEFSQEQLIGIGNIVSTLFLAESKPDIELLMEQFLVVFEQGEDKLAGSTLVNWFRQLAIHGRVKPEDYASLAEVYRSVEEVKGMLQTTFKKQQERWYQQGVIEGREEGREEGIEEERAQIARTMHNRGFDLTTIADITGLTEDELTALLTAPPPEDETP